MSHFAYFDSGLFLKVLRDDVQYLLSSWLHVDGCNILSTPKMREVALK